MSNESSNGLSWNPGSNSVSNPLTGEVFQVDPDTGEVVGSITTDGFVSVETPNTHEEGQNNPLDTSDYFDPLGFVVDNPPMDTTIDLSPVDTVLENADLVLTQTVETVNNSIETALDCAGGTLRTTEYGATECVLNSLGNGEETISDIDTTLGTALANLSDGGGNPVDDRLGPANCSPATGISVRGYYTREYMDRVQPFGVGNYSGYVYSSYTVGGGNTPTAYTINGGDLIGVRRGSSVTLSDVYFAGQGSLSILNQGGDPQLRQLVISLGYVPSDDPSARTDPLCNAGDSVPTNPQTPTTSTNSNCPAPVINVNCGSCESDDEETEPEPCEECPEYPEEELCEDGEPKRCPIKYKLWKPIDGGCYCSAANAPPENSSDSLLAEGDDPCSFVAAAIESCGPKAKKWRIWQSVDRRSCRITDDKTDATADGYTQILESEDAAAIATTYAERCVQCTQEEQQQHQETNHNVLDTAGVCELQGGKIPGFATVSYPISFMLGLVTRQGVDIRPRPSESGGVVDSVIVGADNGIRNVFRTVTKSIDSVMTATFRLSSCVERDIGTIQMGRAILGLLGRFFGNAVDQALRPLDQIANFNCPTELPSPAEATSAYLRDEINQETLECWVKAAGFKWTEWERVVRANRTHLNPNELLIAWKREIISDDEFDKGLRENGFIFDREKVVLKELFKFIPPISDLIRFMVRDVADSALVTKYGLSDQFNDKWQSQVKQWGESQGIEPSVALAYWQAHWTWPAPGQLYTMYHRLRNLPDGDSRKVDYDTIKTALIAQDIAPYWIDKFLAISFRPLTRVDVRRAYNLGVLDDNDVVKAYQDGGYSDDNSRTLLAFAKKDRAKQLLTSRRARAAVKGLGPIDDFRNWAYAQIPDYDQVTALVQEVENQRAAWVRETCIKAANKAFLKGTLSISGAMEALTYHLGNQSEADQVLSAWKCQRLAMTKAPATSAIVNNYLIGATDAGTAYQRLQDVGHTADDSIGIVRDATIRLGERTISQQSEWLRDITQRKNVVSSAIKTQFNRIAKSAISNGPGDAGKRRAPTVSTRQWRELFDRIAQSTEGDVETIAKSMRLLLLQLRKATPITDTEYYRTSIYAADTGMYSSWPDYAELLRSAVSDLSVSRVATGNPSP